MSFLFQLKNSRSFLRRAHPIVWGTLACLLLLVSAACEQSRVTQSNRAATTPHIISDPEVVSTIYRTTFTTSTTYTQAHELLKKLNLSVDQWDCIPRSEGSVPSVSAAMVPFLPLTTPPPSQDMPAFFAQHHELIVGYWETPTPQQIAQLQSSPQVVSVKAIPFVSC